MKMVSKAYLSDRDDTTCIKKLKNNNTRSNNQSEKTYGILQVVINVTGRKQAQNKFNI